jgi:hypothetical protein
MKHFTESDVHIAGAAIANARGNRHGVPAIVDILEVIGPKLREEVIEDTRAALEALDKDSAITRITRERDQANERAERAIEVNLRYQTEIQTLEENRAATAVLIDGLTRRAEEAEERLSVQPEGGAR